MPFTKVKPWAWTAVIVGIALIVAGFMARWNDEDKERKGDDKSAWMLVSVGLGAFLTLCGFLTMLKLNKGAGASAPIAAKEPAAEDIDGSSASDMMMD